MPEMSEIWIKNVHHAKLSPPGYEEGVYQLAEKYAKVKEL
jgi:hypothetical protein